MPSGAIANSRGTLNMTNAGKTLYELQQIDLTLRKNKQRLQAIAGELANHAPVKRAQKAVSTAETKLKPLQSDMRDLELQVQSTEQKRKGSEQRLYSGSVSNPKELQDIEQNIASLKRWQSELEDRQLELMMAVESASEALEQAEETLRNVMNEAAASNQDLLSEKETLESDIVKLNTQRETVTVQLEQSHLDLYQEMQTRMAFRPIAVLNDERTCSTCGVQQTTIHAQAIRQSNDEDLMRCTSCNRILIAI